VHEHHCLPFLDHGFFVLLNEPASAMWAFFIQRASTLEVIAEPEVQSPEWLLSLVKTVMPERNEVSTWLVLTTGSLIVHRQCQQKKDRERRTTQEPCIA